MDDPGTMTIGSAMSASSTSIDQLIACTDCDRLTKKPELRPHQIARCRYCGALLRRGHGDSLQPVIALSLASLILFAIANLFPFVSLRSGGVEQEIRLSSGLFAMAESGVPLPGLVAIGFILIAPILRLAGYLYVLVPLWRHTEPPAWRAVLRLANFMLPWSMLEIYLLSVVVALVKISELGSIVIGVSFWSFVLLVVTSTWLSSITDRFALWELVELWRQK